MPPKGWKKGDKPQPTILKEIEAIVDLVGVPDGFKIGQWYKPIDSQPIMLSESDRVLRWSVIRFEVIKIAYGVIAVRFEDGSFEAMIDPDYEMFAPVNGPKY